MRHNMAMAHQTKAGKNAKLHDKIYDHYIESSQHHGLKIFLDALTVAEPLNRLPIYDRHSQPDLLHAIVKGNYAISLQSTPMDRYLQRAGMKSAAHDSLPKQAFDMKMTCSRCVSVWLLRAHARECMQACICAQ